MIMKESQWIHGLIEIIRDMLIFIDQGSLQRYCAYHQTAVFGKSSSNDSIPVDDTVRTQHLEYLQTFQECLILQESGTVLNS